MYHLPIIREDEDLAPFRNDCSDTLRESTGVGNELVLKVEYRDFRDIGVARKRRPGDEVPHSSRCC